MNDKIGVIVVDDHPLFREGVVNTIQAESDMEIKGQGASAEAALHLARDVLPDIAILDITMPGGGINAVRMISADCPVTKIIMLTVSEEEDDVVEALRAGARAYILKGVSARELVRILRSVHSGEVYVAPALAASILMDLSGDPAKSKHTKGPLDELTEREKQVLELLATGFSNREIGERLYLSEKTVKHYMTNILQKLQVHNRVEAALMAQRAGVGGEKN